MDEVQNILNQFEGSNQPSQPGDPQAPQADTGDPVQSILNQFQGTVTPPDVSSANKSLGSADYNGLCQAFVEQNTLGHTGVYPTAADAWNTQISKAHAGLTGVQPGDAVYFAPDASNQGAGHTGIYTGNGKFTSATDNGVESLPIDKWQKMTGQQVLGYIPFDSLKAKN